MATDLEVFFFICHCAVYETNSSCQTKLFNLFIPQTYDIIFLWFLYVHTCSWCILLEFFGEVITAVNNGNSQDASCIFAQTIDRALRTGEAVNESVTPRLVLLLPSYFSSHIIFS